MPCDPCRYVLVIAGTTYKIVARACAHTENEAAIIQILRTFYIHFLRSYSTAVYRSSRLASRQPIAVTGLSFLDKKRVTCTFSHLTP